MSSRCGRSNYLFFHNGNPWQLCFSQRKPQIAAPNKFPNGLNISKTWLASSRILCSCSSWTFQKIHRSARFWNRDGKWDVALWAPWRPEGLGFVASILGEKGLQNASNRMWFWLFQKPIDVRIWSHNLQENSRLSSQTQNFGEVLRNLMTDTEVKDIWNWKQVWGLV